MLSNQEDRASMKFTDEEKANILQKQFASVFIDEPAGGIPILTSRTNSRIADLVIMIDMVKKELVCLNTNKSTEHDGIHPRLLKELAQHNKLIKGSQLPSDWKMAYISPLFKKGSRNLPDR